ncbi:MAG: phosphatase PAP2 family protein [Crenarchaeota archaeon]|nr:phosphatase PAP2 family protein [Thermoproteota archaeon]
MFVKNQELILISIISLFSFLILHYLSSSFSDLNMTVHSWMGSIQNEGFTQLSILIHNWLDTVILLSISLILSVVLFFKKHFWSALSIAGAMGGSTLLLKILKTVIESPRPSNELHLGGDFSFPSGHLTSTIVFSGILFYVLYQNRQTLSVKLCALIIVPSLSFLVAFSRLYLNLHWFNDILAAPFLAFFILSTTILVITFMVEKYDQKLLCFFNKIINFFVN